MIAIFAWWKPTAKPWSPVIEGFARKPSSIAVAPRPTWARDEREGFRGLLNLGHTFGHALEAECGYGDKLLHGEAVAIGMAMAFDLSVALGLARRRTPRPFQNHIKAVGLPADFRGLRDASWSAEKLIAHMSRDKKVVDGKIAFVLTRGVGKAFLSDRVSPDALRSLITTNT